MKWPLKRKLHSGEKKNQDSLYPVQKNRNCKAIMETTIHLSFFSSFLFTYHCQSILSFQKYPAACWLEAFVNFPSDSRCLVSHSMRLALFQGAKKKIDAGWVYARERLAELSFAELHVVFLNTIKSSSVMKTQVHFTTQLSPPIVRKL